MAEDWFYHNSGQTFGPMSAKQLRQHALAGKITRSDHVRIGTEGSWAPATKVKGLFDPLPAPVPVAKSAPTPIAKPAPVPVAKSAPAPIAVESTTVPNGKSTRGEFSSPYLLWLFITLWADIFQIRLFSVRRFPGQLLPPKEHLGPALC